MIRRLIAATVAAAVIAPAASAATAKHHARHHQHSYSRDDRIYDGRVPEWEQPGAFPQSGPPWRGPNQCWEDLGYGRYERCD